MDDLVDWIQKVLDDCSARAPFGIHWELDREESPLVLSVSPADSPTDQIVLSRDGVGERIGFVERLQAFLDVQLDGPVPFCPTHRLGLAPTRAGEEVVWRCREGDFGCLVGHYELEAFWPPRPDEERRRIAPMLARRFRQQEVTRIALFSVESREDRWVARIRVRPGVDERAVREAAEPLLVELEYVDDVRTVREHRPATEREAAYRILTLVGTMIQAAALRGRLRRASAEDGCDFLVDETRVRLLPEHQIGPPGTPLLLDGTGAPFADEGDQVSCGGGFARNGPVRGKPVIFNAGLIRIYEPAAQQ